MKHLTAATEELTKFEDELKKFNVWSDATGKELDRQIQAVQESDNIRRITELHKVGHEVKHLEVWFDGEKSAVRLTEALTRSERTEIGLRMNFRDRYMYLD